MTDCARRPGIWVAGVGLVTAERDELEDKADVQRYDAVVASQQTARVAV